MRPRLSLGLVLTLAFAATGCMGDEQIAGPPPTITGQGFNLAAAVEAQIGAFPDVRVRVEAPERIRALSIRERSYEVDLATTSEQAHLPLFGLQKRTHRMVDVTLNLNGYLNTKLVEPGEYRITITAADTNNQAASAVIHAVVIPVAEHDQERPAPEAPQETSTSEPIPLSEGRFEFRRIGGAAVIGAMGYGITWRTVDPIHVGIQIRPTDSGVALIDGIDFEAIDNRAELLAAVDTGAAGDVIRFDTANDAAAGRSFGIVGEKEPVVLRVAESHTSLSTAGTTVTLKGDFKH